MRADVGNCKDLREMARPLGGWSTYVLRGGGGGLRQRKQFLKIKIEL
jgi:hypothetical protein